MQAPHLPYKQKNIELGAMFNRFKIIGLSLILGGLAGLTGALIVLGWIWPYVGEGDIWAQSQIRSPITNRQLEDRVKQEMKNRVVTIYKKSSSLYGTDYFDPANKIADALMIGTDGWLVTCYSGSLSLYKNWKIVLNDGMIYGVDLATKDPYSDLVYLHLLSGKDGSKQFKVVSFSDQEIKIGDEVYVLQNGDWNYDFVKFSTLNKIAEGHLDTASVVTYSLSNDFQEGSAVVDHQGKVVGLIKSDYKLLSFETITRTMPYILSQSEIEYPSLGIEGWFSDEVPIQLNGELVSGFMITKVLPGNKILKVGDIITAIGGQEVNAFNYRDLIFAQKDITINVIRRGENLALTTSVNIIK